MRDYQPGQRARWIDLLWKESTHRTQGPSERSEKTNLNASCVLHKQARDNGESLRPYRDPGATINTEPSGRGDRCAST